MDRAIAFELGRICERAALACAPLVGRGDRYAADDAATKAMRQAFDDIGICGTVVIGEGERDEAPMLYIGERVGNNSYYNEKLKIAVDPLEGTNLCANGLPGAITVIAAAVDGEGDLLNAPDVYMDKLAVGEACRGVVDLNKTPTENLQAIASALKKPISEVTVIVMDRPRNENLIKELRTANARIRLISDGDVAGALAAAKPNSGIDCLMGIGAAPEGVLAAAAMRAMQGELQGRLWFKDEAQKQKAIDMDITDLNKVYRTEDLASGHVMFAATGVTTGDFLKGVRYNEHGALTNTVVMRSKTNTIRWQEVEHHFGNNLKV